MPPRVDSTKARCEWCGTDPVYVRYHDREWGVPLRNDRRLFEMLILEGAQAGLAWITILRKRDGYREAFDGFDAERIARYTKRKIERLLLNPAIVRNRLKVESTVSNARAFLAVQEEFGSFRRYIWQFVDGRPKINAFRSLREIPAATPEAEAMSRNLKKRGFRFVGPTICYAYMQSVGMVNDHVVGCYRYKEINAGGARGRKPAGRGRSPAKKR